MSKQSIQAKYLAVVSLSVFLSCLSQTTQAVIDGESGTNFNFVACTFNILTPDGDSVPMFGYGLDSCDKAQYPGPTLIVNQNDTVTINLTNQLPFPTSIVFPGQVSNANGGDKGLLTQEAPISSASTVTYTFTADKPGTFMYESGTNPALQTEMGLLGAIVVRPTGFDNTLQQVETTSHGTIEKANPDQTAYNHPDSFFDYEYLFILTEMDPDLHRQYAQGRFQQVDNTRYRPVLWFINGRNFPNTLSPTNDPSLPHQPYSIVPQTRPGEKVLMRMIGGSRHAHPFHTHGANFQVIAQDGQLLESAPGAGADLGRADYTLLVYPGQTYDALFVWTGKEMGWDLYGDPNQADSAHTCNDLVNNETGNTQPDNFDDVTYEWCPDHGKALPVNLPSVQDLTFGGFYSGTPFLGKEGTLPPEEGGLNPEAAYLFAWHSHNERELVNNDVFPGGMFTGLFLHSYNVSILSQ